MSPAAQTQKLMIESERFDAIESRVALLENGMPSDAETIANLLRQVTLKDAAIDELHKRLDKAPSSWSDSFISVATWIGSNKAAIGVTLLFFLEGYRQAFPTVPPAPAPQVISVPFSPGVVKSNEDKK